MRFKLSVAFFLLAGWVSAQPLGVGLKLGVPASDGYKVLPIPTFSPFNAKAQPFIFGPYVELRLPANTSIELDALRRSHEFLTAAGLQQASSWEFPLLLKHKIGKQLVKPFFEGGVSLSRLSDVTTVNFSNRTNYGLLVGGGLEFNLLILKISPELRYTAYALRTLDQPNVQSRRGQLAILLGIGF